MEGEKKKRGENWTAEEKVSQNMMYFGIFHKSNQNDKFDVLFSWFRYLDQR